MEKIIFLSLEWTGTIPDKAICPICGEEVNVVEMAYEGNTHYRKCFNPGYTGSNGHDGLLSCGHEFTYKDIDHKVLRTLHKEYGYVCNLLEVADEYYLRESEYKEQFLQDINELFEGSIPRSEQYSDHVVYEKLHAKFGDMDFKREDNLGYDKSKNAEVLKRLYTPPTVYDSPKYTLDEYESLSQEEKEDERYIIYLERVIYNNFKVWDKDWELYQPPIDFDEIPEEDKRKVYEFTIKLFANNK